MSYANFCSKISSRPSRSFSGNESQSRPISFVSPYQITKGKTLLRFSSSNLEFAAASIRRLTTCGAVPPRREKSNPGIARLLLRAPGSGCARNHGVQP